MPKTEETTTLPLLLTEPTELATATSSDATSIRERASVTTVATPLLEPARARERRAETGPRPPLERRRRREQRQRERQRGKRRYNPSSRHRG